MSIWTTFEWSWCLHFDSIPYLLLESNLQQKSLKTYLIIGPQQVPLIVYYFLDPNQALSSYILIGE